jgi:Na+/H+-dicarboxylate symporter
MTPLLSMMNPPASGIGVLLAIDTIPDMFRLTANVTGWLCVSGILSRDASGGNAQGGCAAGPDPSGRLTGNPSIIR